MADNKQLPELTAAYVEEHMGGVHTFESFGRVIAGEILTQTLAHVATGSLKDNQVTVQLEFQVNPTPSGCMMIRTNRGDRVHVPINT